MARPFKRLKKKLIAPFFFSVTDVIAVLDLSDFTPDDGVNDTVFSCRLLESGDLERVASQMGEGRAAVFSQRLPESQGYLALEAETVVGWAWTSRSVRSEEGLRPFLYRVAPRKGSVYIYDMFTSAQARNRGVMKRLLSHLLADVKQAGVRSAFLTYGEKNEAMHRLTSRAGFYVAGKIAYRRRLWRVETDTADLEKVCDSS